MEWLRSPLSYVKQGGFRADALALLLAVCDMVRGRHHYRHMATTNHRGYLRGERESSADSWATLDTLFAKVLFEESGACSVQGLAW